MSNTNKNKIGKATAWSSFTEIALKLVSPIVNLALVRVLAPAAFGAVATITIIISFAEIFADAGFQKYIIQHEFESDDELDKSTNVAFWSNLAVSALIVGVIVAFRDQLAVLVGSPGLGLAIAVSSLNVFMVAFSSIQTARYKRDFDFKSLFAIRIGSAFIPLVVTVPAALIFKNYWALVIGTLASNLFVAVAITIKAAWKPGFYYSFALLKRMLSFSIWTLLESFSFWLTSSIGTFIVGNYLNEHYLGLYKTTMSTINAYMGIITAATTPVLFSALSRYQNDDVNFKKNYYLFQRYCAMLLFPMGVGIFLFRDLVTSILLGSQWMEASGFIGLWGFVSALSCVLSNYNGEVLRSKGKPKWSLVLQLQHLAFLVPTLIITAKMGFEALYVARSLIRFELMFAGLILIKVLFGFKFKDICKNLMPMTVSTLIMGAAGWGLKQISDHIVWQFAVIAICVVIYFLAIWFLFPKLRAEISDTKVFRKIFGRSKKSKQVCNSSSEDTTGQTD